MLAYNLQQSIDKKELIRKAFTNELAYELGMRVVQTPAVLCPMWTESGFCPNGNGCDKAHIVWNVMIREPRSQKEQYVSAETLNARKSLRIVIAQEQEAAKQKGNCVAC